MQTSRLKYLHSAVSLSFVVLPWTRISNQQMAAHFKAVWGKCECSEIGVWCLSSVTPRSVPGRLCQLPLAKWPSEWIIYSRFVRILSSSSCWNPASPRIVGGTDRRGLSSRCDMWEGSGWMTAYTLGQGVAIIPPIGWCGCCIVCGLQVALQLGDVTLRLCSMNLGSGPFLFHTIEEGWSFR